MVGLVAPAVCDVRPAPPLLTPFAFLTSQDYLANRAYLEVAGSEQIAVLIAGLVALGLASVRSFRALPYLGVGALALIAYGYVAVNARLQLHLSAVYNPHRHQHILAQTVHSTGMRWGWLLLGAGACLILASGAMAYWLAEKPVVVDYGPCAQCGQANSHQAVVCYHCGAPLPWARQQSLRTATQPVPKPVSHARSAPKPAVRQQGPPVDWGFWGVALLSFLFPVIGYFLYRSYSNNGDDKAGAAGLGALLGLLLGACFYILRIVLPAVGKS